MVISTEKHKKMEEYLKDSLYKLLCIIIDSYDWVLDVQNYVNKVLVDVIPIDVIDMLWEYLRYEVPSHLWTEGKFKFTSEAPVIVCPGIMEMFELTYVYPGVEINSVTRDYSDVGAIYQLWHHVGEKPSILLLNIEYNAKVMTYISTPPIYSLLIICKYTTLGSTVKKFIDEMVSKGDVKPVFIDWLNELKEVPFKVINPISKVFEEVFGNYVNEPYDFDYFRREVEDVVRRIEEEFTMSMEVIYNKHTLTIGIGSRFIPIYWIETDLPNTTYKMLAEVWDKLLSSVTYYVAVLTKLHKLCVEFKGA